MLRKDRKENAKARKETRKKYLGRPTRAKLWEYEDARRDAKKVSRSKKWKFLYSIIAKLEQDFKINRSREEYEAVNLFMNRYILRSSICRNKDGVVVAEKEEVLGTWRVYFSLLLKPNSVQTNDQLTELADGDEEDPIEPR